ncbi:MAG TPA: universal stress protein [Pyrinomonadaceae bacterium]|nr:universal stress protein [Pyrinomonadaceae bacterium]
MKELIKLLIGYDGSVCANAALDDLRRAGLPRKAEAVVLTVSEFWLPHASETSIAQTTPSGLAPMGLSQTKRSAASSAQPVTEARALAQEGKRLLQAHFPGWKIKAEESSGSPAHEILKKAEEWAPDLVAVGSQGHSRLGRFLLGSVSQKIVNEAHCSVRVARGTAWKDGSPVRILVGLDGSWASSAAVQSISMRMWPPASEVRLITVVDPPTAGVGSPRHGSARKDISGSVAGAPVWVQEFVETATKKLRAAELVVSSKIEEGDPKQLIVANAEEWGAECIFIGASCRRQFEQFLLGSVATAVVSRAHCSVEVVRDRADLIV